MGLAGLLWLTKESEKGGLVDKFRGFARDELPLPIARWASPVGPVRVQEVHAVGEERKGMVRMCSLGGEHACFSLPNPGFLLR